MASAEGDGASRDQLAAESPTSSTSEQLSPSPTSPNDESDEEEGRWLPLRDVSDLVGARRWLALVLVAVSLPAAFCESAVLVIVAEVAGALVQHESRVVVRVGPFHLSSSQGHLLWLGLGLALLRIALQGPLAYIPARLLADAQAEMRRRLTRAHAAASWSAKAGESEGQFQELLTSQVIQATYVVQQSLLMLSLSTTLVVLVAAALAVGLIPALVVMLAGGALFALLRPLAKMGARRANALSGAQLAYAEAMGEMAQMAAEAQVFGAGPALSARADKAAEVISLRYRTTLFLGSLAPGVYYGLVLVLLVGGLAVVIWTGGGRLVALGASVLLLVRAANYGQQLQSNYQAWHQQLPFLRRVLDAERGYRAAKVMRGSGLLTGVPDLVFDRVAYSYGRSQPAVHDISFRVEPGEAIGVVGPTGAGKSTLIQLVLSLRRPMSGSYLIGGQPPERISERELTRGFAYVPQEPRLLHATVAENISFFRSLDDRTIEKAARLARVDAEIRRWPRGYETLIGQRADGISGGQRQRICLARALAGGPSVLVLDEPTSSLDPHSESLVAESLEDLRGSLTILVVAHRLSTLSFCDRVMVIVDGRLEAFGPASELSKHNEFFRRASDLHAAPSRQGIKE